MKILSKKSILFLTVCGGVALTSWACKTVTNVVDSAVPLSTDAAMGLQTANEISANPAQYPLLPERGNEQIYGYVRGIANNILNSGAVEHKADFPWQIKIINDPKTLNAFCTPGGYIYVYSGLIKYLDSEDQLAGVMGHEMGHADKRHSTNQMIETYGLQAVVSVVGNALASKQSSATAQQAVLTGAQVLTALGTLRFSRAHETEADNQSVKYLCNTPYNAAGAAGFFQKLGNAGSPPEFLSTHPSPSNRVENIMAQAQQKSCSGGTRNTDQYTRMKNLLR